MSNQTPYIGSKINLISKLDIRYEGILYTVDTNDSTIALAKVRSFGTEDRPTENPVAPRDDVYEYIIFKASDIKDLIVCETPKPAPLTGGLPYDPAIVSVSSRAAPSAQDVHPSAGSSRSGTPHRVSPGNQGMNRAPGTGRNMRGAPRGGYFPNRSPGMQGQQMYRGQHMNMRIGGQQQPNRSGHPIPREKLKFDSEFDFEKANEEFTNVLDDLKELKIGGEEKPVEPKEDENPPFYDKKSSFFDRISCEALEKQEGKKSRPDWKKERETNQETFGQNAVRSMNYRRGYGMRGMRGGRFNGGQGYGSYNSGYGGGRGGGYGGYGSQPNRGYQRRQPQRQEQADK